MMSTAKSFSSVCYSDNDNIQIIRTPTKFDTKRILVNSFKPVTTRSTNFRSRFPLKFVDCFEMNLLGTAILLLVGEILTYPNELQERQKSGIV